MDGSGELIRAIAASQLGFRYEELRKATDDFNQINKLGQGVYGSVYKVHCHAISSICHNLQHCLPPEMFASSEFYL
jgi:hypothetical protein